MHPTIVIALIYSLIIGCDWRFRRIPHLLTIGGAGFAGLAAADLPAGSQLHALVGGIIGWVFFYSIRVLGRAVFGRDALGFGDVMLGMLLGTVGGVVAGLYAAALGMLLAGLYSIVGLATGKLERTSTLPYGVFLAIGGLLVLLTPVFDHVR